MTGNTIVDSIKENMRSMKIKMSSREGGAYVLLTLHRQENVDSKKVFGDILKGLSLVHERLKLPIIFPMHHRTAKMARRFGLKMPPGIVVTQPCGIFDFLRLEANASLVLTDSGGVQEESTYLNLPCLTVRPNTERPVTLTEGTNKLVKPGDIVAEVKNALAGDWPTGRRPELWDGQTAQRCVDSLRRRISSVN